MTDDPVRGEPAPGESALGEMEEASLLGGVTRRQFLLGSAATAAGGVLWAGCAPPAPGEFEAQSRLLVSEDTLTAYENWYATSCRGCDAGCGVIVRVIEGRSKKVEGNPSHPVNLGKMCARGQASVQDQYHPDRIQSPLRQSGPRGLGSFGAISWSDALDTLVGQLGRIRQSGRARDIAFITSPLRASQAFVMDSFTRGLGAEWLTLDTVNDAPYREAVRRVFGQATLPEFDVQNARFIMSFGADWLGTWLSPVHYGTQYGVFRQGNYRVGQFQPRQGRPRGRMVHVSSRFDLTAANADEWIYVPPGGEGWLALGIAQVLMADNLGDAAGVQALGGARALDAYTPDRVSQETGISADRIRALARDFANQRPALAIGGGSAGAQTNGTDALTAILALNTLAGNVGRSGGVLLNPPAPVSGLPAPTNPSRLTDLQGLADRLRNGQTQAVLIYNANPVHDLPSALRFREALAAAPFVVSFSSFMDETTAMADLVLPSHLPLEDWGDDIPDPGPGYAVYTIQQPVVRPLYNTRSVWDVLLTTAQELGGGAASALTLNTFRELLRQNARSLQGQNRGNVQDSDFERFWNKLLQQGGWWDTTQTGGSPGAGGAGGLSTSSQPPRFDSEGDNNFRYFLVPFPHHTIDEGSGAHLPWLQATPDPITTVTWQTWVEVNPDEADRLGIREGDIVAIESRDGGRIEVPVYVNPAASDRVLAVPLGQGHTSMGRWATRDGKIRGANPMDLLAPLTDQATGALAYGATRVRLVKTGRHVELPKFEGFVPAYQLPGAPIIEITRGDA